MNHVRNHYDFIFRFGRKEISNVMKKLLVILFITLFISIFNTSRVLAKEEASPAAEISRIRTPLPGLTAR